MIRKWLLASLASGVIAVGMVGCGEEPTTPVKDTKIKTKVDTAKKVTTDVKADTAKPATGTKTTTAEPAKTTE